MQELKISFEDAKTSFEDAQTSTVAYATEINTILKENGLLEKSTAPVTAALVNNELVSLNTRLKINAEIKPIFLDTKEGARIYRKTLTVLLSKVCSELFPERTLLVGHSLSTGYYCSFDNFLSIDKKDLDKIYKELKSQIERNIKIEYLNMSYSDACKAFSMNDSKELLLKYKNDAIIPVYCIDGWTDIAFETLLPYTGMLKQFDIMEYNQGFILMFPHTTSPNKMSTFEDNPLLKTVYNEYKAWGKIHNIDCVGKLNRLSDEKEIRNFIRVAETLQEKKLSQISDAIAMRRDKIKVVLIAGPSSSGKTTFTKKLAIHLRVNGFNPQLISLDDYYVNRELTPKDESGNFDFEALEAIDIPLLNADLLKLFDGEEIEIPTFNFKTGLREYRGNKIKMEDRNILLIEGIHGLNNKLTERIPHYQKFKIYISALTQLNLDNNNRIATTDNRLIRRIVRDYQFRGYSALKTLAMWDSVRRGEKRNIFPFQNNADVAFNSALDYELAVLKNLAVPVLKAIKPWHKEYAEASRLLGFLNNFITIQPKHVPRNSILREFLGDSDFKY